jgi:hypothetical protein
VTFEALSKERAVVELLMAWSVVTLETLVNHALAVRINSEFSAIVAIEFPGRITDSLPTKIRVKSELAKKLYILLDEHQPDKRILEKADALAARRNEIVHDKPFSLNDLGEGEVEIRHFRARRATESLRITFEDLEEYYASCQEIVEFVAEVSELDIQFLKVELDFSKLIRT